jgi:hypothetical protein
MTKELTRMQDARVQWVRDLAKCNLPYPGNSGLDGFAAGWDEGFACARAQDQADKNQWGVTSDGKFVDRRKKQDQAEAGQITDEQIREIAEREVNPAYEENTQIITYVIRVVRACLALASPRATAEQNPAPSYPSYCKGEIGYWNGALWICEDATCPTHHLAGLLEAQQKEGK